MIIPAGMAKNRGDTSPASTMDNLRSERSSPAPPTNATAPLTFPGENVTCNFGGLSHRVVQKGVQQHNAPASVQMMTAEPPVSVWQVGAGPAHGAAQASSEPWIAQSAVASDQSLPPRSPWEEGAYAADTEPEPCPYGHNPRQLDDGCSFCSAHRRLRIALEAKCGCGVFADIPQEGFANIEAPPTAIVSFPEHDWNCTACSSAVKETDRSRRWVKPRLCQQCAQPMKTWRALDSASSIFKPEGRLPSPREVEVHQRPAVKQEPTAAELEPQPSSEKVLAKTTVKSEWAISMQEGIKVEVEELTIELGKRNLHLQIPEMQRAVATAEITTQLAKSTWDDDQDPPPNTQPAVLAKSTWEDDQATVSNTECAVPQFTGCPQGPQLAVTRTHADDEKKSPHHTTTPTCPPTPKRPAAESTPTHTLVPGQDTASRRSEPPTKMHRRGSPPRTPALPDQFRRKLMPWQQARGKTPPASEQWTRIDRVFAHSRGGRLDEGPIPKGPGQGCRHHGHDSHSNQLPSG